MVRHVCVAYSRMLQALRVRGRGEQGEALERVARLVWPLALAAFYGLYWTTLGAT